MAWREWAILCFKDPRVNYRTRMLRVYAHSLRIIFLRMPDRRYLAGKYNLQNLITYLPPPPPKKQRPASKGEIPSCWVFYRKIIPPFRHIVPSVSFFFYYRQGCTLPYKLKTWEIE